MKLIKIFLIIIIFNFTNSLADTSVNFDNWKLRFKKEALKQKISKVTVDTTMSKVRFLPWGTLEGTIYLNIDGLLMYDGDGWVQLYGFHDIPEYVWDEFYDDVLGYISKFVNITNQYGFTIDITHPTQFD